EFYSDDPDKLEDDFDEDFFDDPKELERMKQEMGPEEFFDAAEALKSVAVLRDHLRHTPLVLAKPPSRGAERVASELIDELTEIEQSLTMAKAQGVKFHFALTPD